MLRTAHLTREAVTRGLLEKLKADNFATGHTSRRVWRGEDSYITQRGEAGGQTRRPWECQ